MSAISPKEVKQEFFKSKMGIAGIGILLSLVIISILALGAIPYETIKGWNNPNSWLEYPKTAIPSWINYFMTSKIPEHKILAESEVKTSISDGARLAYQEFSFMYEYDEFPKDFIYSYSAKYSKSPLLKVSVIRPDGISLELVSSSLPYSSENTSISDRIFSTEQTIRKNLHLQSKLFLFAIDKMPSQDIVFSQTQENKVLKGKYTFLIHVYSIEETPELYDSKLIIGGKTFGMMGTDELRRDLAVGLLWGTPLALFIGLVVSIGSVSMGLVYGVYAGFRGKKTDELMMRFNDIIYALPALPFLIILAVTISNSIFLMILFLMIFGWVGIAKVSRSMALQIKTRGYVEAAKIMGQKNSKIIFKHIIPQLLPYAFASVAISVPAAITTEAGLSFLGLGDPSFPTWGQILHDANVHGAAARGLWWWIVPPGIMIAITGLSFVFMGNALDSIVNPRLRR